MWHPLYMLQSLRLIELFGVFLLFELAVTTEIVSDFVFYVSNFSLCSEIADVVPDFPQLGSDCTTLNRCSSGQSLLPASANEPEAPQSRSLLTNFSLRPHYYVASTIIQLLKEG